MALSPNWKSGSTKAPQASALTAEERSIRQKRELHERLIAAMDLSSIGTMEEVDLRKEVRRAAEELSSHGPELLNYSEREQLVNEVLDETFGLGPLEPLMRDPTITDILINGHKTVYVERGGVLERAPVTFSDEKHLIPIVQRIVNQAGRRVDETSPMVDSRLPDGS